MSISSQINRLSSAKDAIKLAISGKGVTVPTTTKLDGYASLVSQIPQGIPIDVSTASGMAAVLTAANVGKAYRFVGTTDATYTNGDIYVVEAS